MLILSGAPDEFVVDLGGLLLQPEHDYAWILDYFVVGDSADHVEMGTGLGVTQTAQPLVFLTVPFSLRELVKITSRAATTGSSNKTKTLHSS